MPSKIIYCIFILLTGCASGVAEVQPNRIIEDFYRLPTSDQLKAFKTHSVEEQYDLFLFGNQAVHPPAIYLARPFAEQGARIVPFLKNKLITTRDETTIRDIITIFSELSHLKLYNFPKDAQLLDLLEQEANSMQGIWKDTTIKMVANIRVIVH